ncbi:hypothetical protein [Lysobacter sp. CA199]|uniref:hypothetical protein n=1 Tax=Lysobacter sp. CA199 TaxID=3455608 RepID=UPI003F8D2A6D
MVTAPPVIFQVAYRGSLNWRVVADGVENYVAFASREACIAAATARARHHHLTFGATTEVWAPRLGGEDECIVRFMTPDKLDAMLSLGWSDASAHMRGACDDYVMHFPRIGLAHQC